MPERLQTACLTIAIALLAGGCADVPPSTLRADLNNRPGRAEAAVQEAKAESAALRADLSAARIAAAKQEAELRELRRQAEEMRQAADTQHAELIALRNERDRLAQRSTIAQVGVADPSALPASAADVAGLRSRLRAMEAALAALTAELAQVKKEMARPPQPVPSAPGRKAGMREEEKR